MYHDSNIINVTGDSDSVQVTDTKTSETLLDHSSELYKGKFLSRKKVTNSFQRHFSKWTQRYFHICLENATLIVESVNNNETISRKAIDIFNLELVQIVCINDSCMSPSNSTKDNTSSSGYYLSICDTINQIEIWMKFESSSMLVMWELKLKSISFEKHQQRKKQHLIVFNRLCDFIKYKVGNIVLNNFQ